MPLHTNPCARRRSLSRMCFGLNNSGPRASNNKVAQAPAESVDEGITRSQTGLGMVGLTGLEPANTALRMCLSQAQTGDAT